MKKNIMWARAWLCILPVLLLSLVLYFYPQIPRESRAVCVNLSHLLINNRIQRNASTGRDESFSKMGTYIVFRDRFAHYKTAPADVRKLFVTFSLRKAKVSFQNNHSRTFDNTRVRFEKIRVVRPNSSTITYERHVFVDDHFIALSEFADFLYFFSKSNVLAFATDFKIEIIQPFRRTIYFDSYRPRNIFLTLVRKDCGNTYYILFKTPHFKAQLIRK